MTKEAPLFGRVGKSQAPALTEYVLGDGHSSDGTLPRGQMLGPIINIHYREIQRQPSLFTVVPSSLKPGKKCVVWISMGPGLFVNHLPTPERAEAPPTCPPTDSAKRFASTDRASPNNPVPTPAESSGAGGLARDAASSSRPAASDEENQNEPAPEPPPEVRMAANPYQRNHTPPPWTGEHAEWTSLGCGWIRGKRAQPHYRDKALLIAMSRATTILCRHCPIHYLDGGVPWHEFIEYFEELTHNLYGKQKFLRNSSLSS